METAEIHRAQAMERKFDRRAARAKRSKWLGKLLFSLTGMGLLLFLRLNPEMAMTVVAMTQGAKSVQTTNNPAALPKTTVRKMPKDFVPVRRGGDLPGNASRAPQQEAQSQADDVSNKLRSLSPTR